ncbi:MAG: TolC family protein [Bacteroidia bacterium]|nr:TolC family protein [Bacteroidia bacterium]
MKRTVPIIITICFVIVSELTWAQKKVLTFQDAIAIAMKNSILLNQQKNNLMLSQMQRTASYAGMGPTLSVNGGATKVNGNTFNQNTGEVVNGIFEQLSGSVNANINIFNGLSQFNQVKQSASLLEAQSYYINRTAQDVINTVSIQYLTVLVDAELLLIAQENFEVLKKQLEQVRVQVELGSRSPVEAYTQDSQTKAAEIRMLQAEIALITDKGSLTQTLLLDPTEQFDIAKPDWDVNTIGAQQINLETLFEVSLKNRGDYLRAKKSEEAAKYAMNASRGGLMPSLSAFGTLYSAYNRAQGDPNVRPIEDQFRTDNLRKVYGLQLNIPILGGNQSFQYRTGYVQQKVNYLNTQTLTKNAEVQVKTDVVRAYENFNLFKRAYTVSVAQLTAAEMAFSLESERYNLGVTNLIDYIQANRILVQAQTDLAQAEYRLLFQKILLDYATGILKPEDLN